MTVQELIDKLQSFPNKDYRVYYKTDTNLWSPLDDKIVIGTFL